MKNCGILAVSMPDILPVELVYEGDDVNDGTVPVDYMIDALVGFSAAYEKVTRRTQPDMEHRIRVVGVRQNSAHILVNVVEWVRVNPAAAGVLVTAGGLIAAGAYRVVSDIAKIIAAKKHLAGAPVQQQLTFNGPTIVLMSANGAPLSLTKEQLEFLQTGTLDPELDKLTAPLQEGRVNEFELKAAEEPLAKVNWKERLYFVHTERTLTTTEDDVPLEGMLNSLTKDKNRGTFHTISGKHIPYRYVGDDQHALLQAFAHEGIVRVKGKVSFDADLNPISVDIRTVELDQRRLF
jgi:hypothetical protein